MFIRGQQYYRSKRATRSLACGQRRSRVTSLCMRALCGAAVFVCCAAVTSARVQAAESAHAPGEQRDLEEARTVYEAAVDAYGEKDYDEAIELFKHANRLKPNAAFSFNIGVAYQDMGVPEQALRYFRDYLRQSPAAPEREG